MITEENIPDIVESMNAGGEHPTGVEAIRIRDNRYCVVYFSGLGVYKVYNTKNIRLIYTEEEVQAIKGN